MTPDNNQDDELQKAIDEVTQRVTANTPQPDAATPETPAQPESIVPQRNMADSNETHDDAVAAAMADVLPGSEPTPTPPSMTQPDTNTKPSTNVAAPASPEMAQVKEQALRELAPLLINMNINPEQKFRIYRDMVETLHDNSLISSALDAAKQIPDENTRADSLLSIVNMIDDLEKK